MDPIDDRTRTAPPQDTPPPTSVIGGRVVPNTLDIRPRPPAPIRRPADGELPVVPGYRVSREIARGGMGVVYAAHDPAFDRPVAIKVMHFDQDAGRFVIEARVTAQLSHPGVPPAYAIGTLPDGRPFLAMKLIRGSTLTGALPAHPVPGGSTELLGAFEQMCQTVGFAHSRGIIHRDLKPSNIMVGAFGEVLVMDWGLAKELRIADRGLRIEDKTDPSHPQSAIRNPQLTAAGHVKGTPAYMAPEQARGEPVDARADVFALGGILAAILTGNPPFAGETAVATVQMAARAEVSDCFARLDSCGADSELVALAKRCLAPIAADRFADGEAVARAVAAHRAGAEARLRSAERDRAAAEARAVEGRKRRRVQLALAASLLATALGGGGAAWWHDRREAERRADGARLAGERDAERRFKEEQARQGVAANTALAHALRKQYKFKEAGAALAQAAELAKGGPPELLGEVERARADLAFVVRLDDIRFRKWTWIAEPGGKGGFNTASAPGEYRRAFVDRGLDPAAPDPAEAAARVAASGVAAELVAAIDDWALYEPDGAVRDRLLAIARRAEPGPWLDRLRDPAVRGNRDAVAALAADGRASLASASSLSALAELMHHHKLDPSPLLTAARTRYPTDFGLAFAQGRWYAVSGAEGREIGAYEAARALRPDSVTVLNNLGNTLKSRGDEVGAVAALREAVRLAPNLPIAHYNLGNTLEDAGDVSGAVAAYREAIRLDPKFATAHSNLGNALRRGGDTAGAVAAFREAIRIDPQHTAAHVNLSDTLGNAGDASGSLAACREALRLAPNFAPAHVNLGNVLKDSGDADGALAAYQEAIRLDPRYALAHTRLADALHAKGDTEGAIASYRQAIRLDPKHTTTHFNLGVALYAKGDLSGAIAACREATRLDPKYAHAHAHLGNALKDRGDIEGAIAAYREAVRSDPKFALAHYNLANVLYAGRGDVEGAIAAHREAIRLDPKYAAAHNNLGAVLYGKGDTAGALAAFREAVRLEPTDAACRYNLGKMLGASGDFEGAIMAYRAAILLAPRHAAAHTDLGAIYLWRKQDAAAVACARAAIQADPKYSNAHVLLSMALQRGGDLPGARAAMTEAARLDAKRWGPLLAKLPSVPTAPPPREATRP